jgi:glycosyltransferase involved in cell wall biosynthesis
MKISIVTVCFNSEATIFETLRSVADQTYPDVEHVIIDGASHDNTLALVQQHGTHVSKIVSESDTGIYDAMNKGMSCAGGEIIGFLNSDDFYADTTVLEKVAVAFEDESVEACFADLVYLTPDTNRVVRYWKSKPFVIGDFAKGWCPAHPTFYIRRSALQRLGGFDESFKMANDVEFMMRYLEQGRVKSVYIPHVLVHMRLGGASNQSWSNVWKQNIEIFAALRKNMVPFSVIGFWVNKLFSRVQQYVGAKYFKADLLRQPTAQPPV